jgi:hypothetical protein
VDAEVEATSDAVAQNINLKEIFLIINFVLQYHTACLEDCQKEERYDEI